MFNLQIPAAPGRRPGDNGDDDGGDDAAAGAGAADLKLFQRYFSIAILV